MRKHALLLLAGLLLIIGSAYVHGVLTDRWGVPDDLSGAAAKLDAIPEVVGDWQSQPLEISEAQLQGAEAIGHCSRVYRNDKLNTEVQVMILCGPNGPIAVHPPTICFTSSGMRQAYPEKQRTVEAGDLTGKFWQTVFTKRSPDGLGTDLETYWAWSVHGECKAPANPRIEYAMSPHLYKIYVTHNNFASGGGDSEESDGKSPCVEFLKVFLPAFKAALSSSS